MRSNDMKCKYMFMFPLQNLARKGLRIVFNFEISYFTGNVHTTAKLCQNPNMNTITSSGHCAHYNTGHEYSNFLWITMILNMFSLIRWHHSNLSNRSWDITTLWKWKRWSYGAFFYLSRLIWVHVWGFTQRTHSPTQIILHAASVGRTTDQALSCHQTDATRQLGPVLLMSHDANMSLSANGMGLPFIVLKLQENKWKQCQLLQTALWQLRDALIKHGPE